MNGTRDHVKSNEPNLERLKTCFLSCKFDLYMYNKDLKSKGNKLRGGADGWKRGCRLKKVKDIDRVRVHCVLI